MLRGPLCQDHPILSPGQAAGRCPNSAASTPCPNAPCCHPGQVASPAAHSALPSLSSSQALKSHDHSTKPLYVSVGHKVSLEAAVRLTRSCCRFRIPEPVRQVGGPPGGWAATWVGHQVGGPVHTTCPFRAPVRPAGATSTCRTVVGQHCRVLGPAPSPCPALQFRTSYQGHWEKQLMSAHVAGRPGPIPGPASARRPQGAPSPCCHGHHHLLGGGASAFPVC